MTNCAKGRTADKVSNQTGLSPATYKRAKKIILEGSESAKQKLRSGKSTIFKEYKRIQIEQIKEKLTHENQKILINLKKIILKLGQIGQIGQIGVKVKTRRERQ